MPQPTTKQHTPMVDGRYQNVLLAILFCTFGFVFFDRLALNFLTPFFKDELHLDNAAIGLIGGIPALTWAISGLLIGFLSDKLNRRKPILIIVVIGFTIFSALSGVVGGLATLLLVRAIMGMAEGGVLPISQTLMMHSSSEKRRGLNMGLVQGSSAGLIGGVLGPIVTVAIAEHFGWRAAFFFTVIPGLVLALLILLFVKELRFKQSSSSALPTPPTLPTDLATGPTPAEALPAEIEDDQFASRPASLRASLLNRNILLCIGIGIFFVTWFITTQTFTPLYLAEKRGFDLGTSSFILVGIGVGWVIWGALVPAFSDRFGRRTAIIVFAIMAAFAPLAIMFISSPVVLFIALCLTYTGLGCFTLWMATIPAERVAPKVMATCLGLIMGIGEFLGGFVAPALAGLLADHVGLEATMVVSSVAALIVVVLAIFLKETAPLKLKAALARHSEGSAPLVEVNP